MDTMRVLVLWLPRAWGLGAVRMVAARTPSPSSPALVIRTSSYGVEPGPPACKSPTTIRDVLNGARTETPEWPDVLLFGSCYWHGRGTQSPPPATAIPFDLSENATQPGGFREQFQ